MDVNFFKKLGWSIVLILLQVFVLNHVQLFGIATPLLYIYFIVQFRRNYPQWGMMLWAFVMGLFIDMFSNTPGVSSFSLTFLSAIQPFVLSSFTSHESAEELKPCIDSLGFGKYLWFVLILTFIYCVVFFSLDMFSFFNLLEWGACILASTLLTIVLILVIENVRRR